MRYDNVPQGLDTSHDPGWDNASHVGGHRGPNVPGQWSPPEPGLQPEERAQGNSPSSYNATEYGTEAYGDGEPGTGLEGGAGDRDTRGEVAGEIPTAGEDLGSGGAGGRRDRRRKKPKRRALRWVAIVTTVAILGAAGAAYAYYQHLNANIRKDALNLGDSRAAQSKANAAGQTPLNILLLGSDSRASKENQRLGGARTDALRKPLADVQMLLHVSADRSNMTVVSVPRDTRLEIPKCTDPDDGHIYPASTQSTINTSLQHGGPGCTVATWESLTGIHIDHFMMIDFSGVVSMADAIGGVPVCVKSNIHDHKSGLKLPRGTTTIKGQQALQWLRTRYGFEDGTDIGRTHAQHMYMNSMVRQLKSGTKLTDPGALMGLADAATKALTVDTGLGTVKKLYDLGNDLKHVPTGRITMTTMPWRWDPENGAHVVPTPDAAKLFTLLRNDQPVDGKAAKKKADEQTAKPLAAAEIPVTVRNGTGSPSQEPVSGRARAVTDKLKALGYTQAKADSTPQPQSGTTITYTSADDKANALAVAKALKLPPTVVKRSSSVTHITLVVGADWTEGTTYPVADAQNKQVVLANSSALNASDDSACMRVNPADTW
ncbi:LCP family protein [Streptomyces sp. NPDC004074]|uniref:LCP family protein n=1 Tax=unclassified Streptomyces TaxID=2593676 RepID=UPI0033AAEF53